MTTNEVDGSGRDDSDMVTPRLIAVYRDELRSFAERLMAGERIGHTLQPTALLNEAWLRLGRNGQQKAWESRRHFFGSMARAMRQVLVDHSREKMRQKRGGGTKTVPLPDDLDVAAPSPASAPEEEVLAINEAIKKLERIDPVGAHLVVLRFFGELTHAEAAAETGISEATAKRKLEHVKKWLIVELSGDDTIRHV